ncbi:hypothetical protein ROU88_09055 [Macrococcus capreoli]|uniref:hypothetical protein n=1 Tax=Macrococcus capreoli TaxID=2982690 RepID=UPI0021D58AB8|nr:hypothetical protein [Macrococcus sp. TMW 2.2395]MCU7557854.1 hypothetical protein [Macrococcus sp. TMW 2.2395]
MPHVHLLAAWQNNDIEKIKELVDHNIETNIIDEDGNEHEKGYDAFISAIQTYLEETEVKHLEWQFDVMHKTERGLANIVIIKISRGDDQYNVSEKAALCIFTFDTVHNNERKMIRAYVEKGVANN